MPIGQFSGWTQYEENCSEPMSSVAFETHQRHRKNKTLAGATSEPPPPEDTGANRPVT